MAADKGLDEGMYYALILEQGDGIAVNKKEAIRYYKMAADKVYSKTLNKFMCIAFITSAF